jgi:uncharacterized membrane protein
MKLRHLLYLGLFLLYLLHNDLWLWRDGHFVFGLPVGFTYHVGYCLAAAVMMWLLTRFAWPSHLEPGGDEAAERAGEGRR